MPRSAIHPGEILADELTELGVTPTELSRQISVPPNRVTQIIHGRRGVTGDTALRLGHWFGTSAQFWLNLQNAYDIRVAEQRAGQEIAQLPTRPAAPVADRTRAAASLGALPKASRSRAVLERRHSSSAIGRGSMLTAGPPRLLITIAVQFT